MFPSELLTVRRIKGKVIPSFLSPDSQDYTRSVIDLFLSGTGKTRGELEKEIRNLETGFPNHKAIRGLSILMERKSYFERPTKLDPPSVRKFLFGVAHKIPLAPAERKRYIDLAADHFGSPPNGIDAAIYGDMDDQFILRSTDAVSQKLLGLEYNRELVETLLMKSDYMKIRLSGGWKNLIWLIKREGLMFRIESENASIQYVIVDGPLTVHTQTTRYGERFASLFRHICSAESWSIESTVRLKAGNAKSQFAFSIDSASSDLFPSVELFREEFPEFPWIVSRDPEPVVVAQRVFYPDLTVRIGDRTVMIDLSRPAYQKHNEERDVLINGKGIPWATVYLLDAGEKPVKGAINVTIPVNWDSLHYALETRLPGKSSRKEETKKVAVEREIPAGFADRLRERIDALLPDFDRISEYVESEGYNPSRVLPELGYRIRWDGLSAKVSRKN